MDDKLSLTRKLQLKELEILKVFQEICTRHNLKYFAIGGTCLGAVRHKGFIPWDDDIDVAMPHEDYQKFREIISSELPSNYGLLGMDTSHHFYLPYVFRLHDKNTAFIEDISSSAHFLNDMGKGISIDLFVLNGMPHNKYAGKGLIAMARFCHLLGCFLGIYFFRSRITQHDKFLEKLSKIAAAPIIWLISRFHAFMSAQEDKMMKKYPFNCSDKIMFIWRSNKPKTKPNKYGWYRMLFPYELFKSSVELPFEDTTISVPAGYDEYLRMEFGNYMELPPEHKRNAHHSSRMIIDFERSYLYYARKAGEER